MKETFQVITEKQVVRLWQDVAHRATLVSEEGELLTVVNPGRLNDSPGADFRDAVIRKSGLLCRGDIEVHVRSSQWRTHRHHLDSIYNFVILHVVLWRDEAVTRSKCQNGKTIPLMTLHKYLPEYGEAKHGGFSPVPISYPHCQQIVGNLPPGNPVDILDNAGEQRFYDKAGKLQAEIAAVGGEQCLYRNIMSALGYSRNKLPFLELAHRLPLKFLEFVGHGAGTEEEYLLHQQALLMGTAGLLPSQRPGGKASDEEWVQRLETVSTSYRPKSIMSRQDWCLFKIRPPNHPVRRLAAMSHLLLRWRHDGIFHGLIHLLKKIVSRDEEQTLEDSLTVSCDGYWAFHYDFGGCFKGLCPNLLGRERAGEIAVNVLLPFIFVWSRTTSQPVLAQQALELYRRYRVLPGNAVTRQMMVQLSLSGSMVNSACRQQGLIHLYQTFCIQGKCSVCKLKVQN